MLASGGGAADGFIRVWSVGACAVKTEVNTNMQVSACIDSVVLSSASPFFFISSSVSSCSFSSSSYSSSSSSFVVVVVVVGGGGGGGGGVVLAAAAAAAANSTAATTSNTNYGSGLWAASAPEQLQPIITSQLTFRAKTPKCGRHVFLTS